MTRWRVLGLSLTLVHIVSWSYNWLHIMSWSYKMGTCWICRNKNKLVRDSYNIYIMFLWLVLCVCVLFICFVFFFDFWFLCLLQQCMEMCEMVHWNNIYMTAIVCLQVTKFELERVWLFVWWDDMDIWYLSTPDWFSAISVWLRERDCYEKCSKIDILY